MEQADVVVVGAGHNSLTTAAYLASAGLQVLVLERNSVVGGGVVTRELTGVPGFRHDQHSTLHQFIMANPMITRDEIGLQEKYGLEYIRPPVVFASIFPDNTVLKQYLDLDATCASIATVSEKDAAAYRAVVTKTLQILPMLMAGMFSPPAPMSRFLAFMEQSQVGRDFINDMNRSVFDLVCEHFENDKVRIHFLKWSAEVMVSPETKGTGSVFHLMCTLGHKYGVAMPRGGSGELSNSLVRCITANGGQVMTDVNVKSAVMENGKAIGVKLEDGRMIRAKKAVVASIHPWLLNDFLDSSLESGVAGRLDRTQTSDYSGFISHYALNSPIQYMNDDPDLLKAFAVETVPATLEELRRGFDVLKYGELSDHREILAISQTVLDPTRAPDGKAVLYLYTFVPFELANGGSAQWDSEKEHMADKMLQQFRSVTRNMGDANIIARHSESPLDFLRHSPSFQRGDILSLGSFIYQFMGARPTVDLSSYNVPGIEHLYLAGPFVHPGGGVMGGGRGTAMRIMADLGMNTDHYA